MSATATMGMTGAQAPDPVYQASPIKRGRSTKAEVEARRQGLYDIVKAMRPMTVRQVYYQATVHGIVDKTEAGYTKVQTDLVLMRRAGTLPYDWLADNTRWQRKPNTFNSVQAALDETARFYRKALWNDVDAYVEIWLEKDALAGVILPVTSKYDVPLMVARGYASLSFLHSAAEYINELDRPVFIYHLGDYDPLGRQCRREDRGDAARVGAGCRHHLRAHRRDAVADRGPETPHPAHQDQ